MQPGNRSKNTNNKVLVLIFALMVLILLMAAYIVAIQPNLNYWAFFLVALAALVSIDLRWLMKTSAAESS